MTKDSMYSINLIRVSESVPTQYKGEAEHVIFNDRAHVQTILSISYTNHTHAYNFTESFQMSFFVGFSERYL